MSELYSALKKQLRLFARSMVALTLTNHRTRSKTDLVEIANAAKKEADHKKVDPMVA
jgi:hypothetical protein